MWNRIIALLRPSLNPWWGLKRFIREHIRRFGRYDVDMKAYLEPLILIGAIIIGALSGVVYSIQASLVEYSIIAMLCCLFFNVSIVHLLQGMKNKKYLCTAWVANFVLLPTIAFAVSSIFIDIHWCSSDFRWFSTNLMRFLRMRMYKTIWFIFFYTFSLEILYKNIFFIHFL